MSRFWIHVGTTVMVVNASNMALAYISESWAWFAISWTSATLAGLGRIYFTGEYHRMSMGYRDLALRLRWEIKEEGYQIGQALPTIKALAERFGTTRTTVRRALNLLADEGIIDVVHGRGSYVLGPNGESGDRPGRRNEVEHYIRHQAALRLDIERTEALAVGWSVSPSTVRRVVAKLITEGVIRRRKGGGFEAA